MTAAKVDLTKSVEAYRARSGRFRYLEVPDLRYLMIDGHGDPNRSPDFARAVEVLYPVAYACKFASKSELGRDYVVPPLEGLWWADDMDTFTDARDKSRWDWTLMLLVPDWIEPGLVTDAIDRTRAKRKLAALDDLRLETLREGLSVQTLHIGPFDEEADVLAEMHGRVIPAEGMRMTGHHHEIYLSDRRRTAPERLRTILRQPVEPA